MTVHVHVDHLVVDDPDFDVAALVSAFRARVQAVAVASDLPRSPAPHVPAVRLRVGRAADPGAVGTAVGAAVGDAISSAAGPSPGAGAPTGSGAGDGRGGRP